MALVTVDGFMRRGRPVPVKATADDACALAPDLRSVVVVRHLGQPVAWQERRDIWWHELVDGRPAHGMPKPVDSEHPFMIAYTSGTTGRPKGAVHVHGGFIVKMARRGATRRPAAGRSPPLGDRHGLDHGPWLWPTPTASA